MKAIIALGIASAALLLAAGGPQTFTGIITDNMCEKGDHKAMEMVDDKCVVECVKNMRGKYVLYDGKNSYVLSDQTTPEQFAAKKVTVTGTLDAATKTIQVSRIVAAK